MLNSPMSRLRAIGIAEGISFLVLLLIAMPLKYLAGIPAPVLVTGWIHGLLFMLYLAAAAHAAYAYRWSVVRMVAALVASVVPLGTFVFDAWLRRDERAAFDRDAITQW